MQDNFEFQNCPLFTGVTRTMVMLEKWWMKDHSEQKCPRMLDLKWYCSVISVEDRVSKPSWILSCKRDLPGLIFLIFHIYFMLCDVTVGRMTSLLTYLNVGLLCCARWHDYMHISYYYSSLWKCFPTKEIMLFCPLYYSRIEILHAEEFLSFPDLWGVQSSQI